MGIGQLWGKLAGWPRCKLCHRLMRKSAGSYCPQSIAGYGWPVCAACLPEATRLNAEASARYEVETRATIQRQSERFKDVKGVHVDIYGNAYVNTPVGMTATKHTIVHSPAEVEALRQQGKVLDGELYHEWP